MAASEHLKSRQFKGIKAPAAEPHREVHIHYSPDWDKPEQARREVSHPDEQLRLVEAD